MLLCIIFYWHSPPQAAGVLIVRSVVKIIGCLFCRTSLMLSCYVETSRLLILPTVIDAPLNYYSIRIDIPHFSETGGARNMVEVLMLGPRRDDFFDVVARQYLGGGCVCVLLKEKRTETRDKNQKCHSQIKLSLMTWHLIHTLEFQCE